MQAKRIAKIMRENGYEAHVPENEDWTVTDDSVELDDGRSIQVHPEGYYALVSEHGYDDESDLGSYWMRHISDEVHSYGMLWRVLRELGYKIA